MSTTRGGPRPAAARRGGGLDVPAPRVALTATLVALALVAQVTVLSRLGLPGAAPDIVLLVVVSLALAYGPTYGVVIGFAAGLGVDLVPPADAEIGRWAFVLTIVGYLAGLARDEARRSAFLPVTVVGVSSAVSVLLYALLAASLDDASVTWSAVSTMLPSAVVYEVALSAFAVPAVLALVHRVDPDRQR